MGGKLEVTDVRDATVRWRDFCQVLVEFYSNASSVDSEDYFFHDIGNLLINIWKSLKNDPCASEKFICDILQAKGDINGKIIRDSSYSEDPQKASTAPVSSDLTKAQDLLFSSDIVKLLDYYVDPKKDKTQYCFDQLNQYSPMVLLIKASNWFFKGQEEQWTLRFSGCGIGAEEGIRLLKVDTMISILQMHSHKDCALFWLDCKKYGSCRHSTPVDANFLTCDCFNKHTKYLASTMDRPEVSFHDRGMAARMELLINYPMFVRQSFARRWKEQFNAAYYTDDCKSYYWRLYEQRLFAGSSDDSDPENKAYQQIMMAVKRVIRRLVENDEKCDFLDGFVYVDMKEGKLPNSVNPDFQKSFTNTKDYGACFSGEVDEYDEYDEITQDRIRAWNEYREKHKSFNKAPEDKVPTNIDCDKVFKAAYHLFYDGQIGG